MNNTCYPINKAHLTQAEQRELLQGRRPHLQQLTAAGPVKLLKPDGTTLIVQA